MLGMQSGIPARERQLMDIIHIHLTSRAENRIEVGSFMLKECITSLAGNLRDI